MSAPKGNRFALGNKGGQPQYYKTVNELWDKAEEYFNSVTTNTGVCKPTKAGLMFHLGFATRKSFYDYKSKGTDANGNSWEHAICMIERFIESCYEGNLYGFAWGGSAFALKNIYSEYWKDETQQEVNQTNRNITVNFGSNTVQSPPESKEDTQ